MNRIDFDKLINTYFEVALPDVDQLYDLVKDESDYAYSLYLLSHYVVTHYSELKFDYVKYINYFAKVTTSFVSPYADLKKFKLDGVNIYIGDNVVAGDGLVIGGGSVLGKHQFNDDIDNKYIIIGINCVIGNNVRICHGADIGDNVTINNGCIIKEKIDSNVVVDIVNQLQIKRANNAYVTSQKLIVYGLVPKYKNTLVIYGEGFYNPKVIIRLKDSKQLDYNITYWDKNKIIIKIKSFSKTTHVDNMIVIMSRGTRVAIINNIALNVLIKDTFW